MLHLLVSFIQMGPSSPYFSPACTLLPTPAYLPLSLTVTNLTRSPDPIFLARDMFFLSNIVSILPAVVFQFF